MYCINCGVKLADTEKKCPLCGVEVFHPELVRGEGAPLYPQERYPNYQVSRWGVQIVTTTAFLLPPADYIAVRSENQQCCDLVGLCDRRFGGRLCGTGAALLVPKTQSGDLCALLVRRAGGICAVY